MDLLRLFIYLELRVRMDRNDYEIWLEYTKSVQKLRNRNIVARKNPQNDRKVRPDLNNKKMHQEIIIPTRVASVCCMNKKEKRKFQEESRIDLHGLTRDRVFKSLESFCSKCISVNIRNIVVITGKGDGILKEEAINWIKSSPTYVVSFFPIYDSREEVGAFAIRLRHL